MKLYKEKEKFWQKIQAKWESGLTAVQLKQDPPVSHVTGIVCIRFLHCVPWWHIRHLQHLQQVFVCLREGNLKIKLRKCQFFQKHLHYLGHLISEWGIQPLPEKVLAMEKLKKIQ